MARSSAAPCRSPPDHQWRSPLTWKPACAGVPACPENGGRLFADFWILAVEELDPDPRSEETVTASFDYESPAHLEHGIGPEALRSSHCVGPGKQPLELLQPGNDGWALRRREFERRREIKILLGTGPAGPSRRPPAPPGTGIVIALARNTDGLSRRPCAGAPLGGAPCCQPEKKENQQNNTTVPTG